MVKLRTRDGSTEPFVLYSRDGSANNLARDLHPVPTPCGPDRRHALIIDCHVHAVADTPGHGRVSRALFNRWNFRFVRQLLGIKSDGGAPFEREAEAKLLGTLDGAGVLDAAVVLAFDAVYDRDGRRDDARTHLYVANDYVAELARKHPKVRFAASVHPYRMDAVAELERCVGLGAVLMKWLPIVQDFDPSDERCFPVYDALAHHQLPLLCHTGGETALPQLNKAVADPALLVPALKRGVRVIAAHCGTRDRPFAADYVPTFVRLAREYEHLYGDTAMLNTPMRSYAYEVILGDDVVRQKLVHGSDWPLPPVPPRRIGWLTAAKMLAEKNWLRRDVRIKKRLGFDDAYWQRAAKLLRVSGRLTGPRAAAAAD